MKHFEIYKKDPATGALYPEGQRRKKGLARILEIVVRDFWQLLGSGLIATAFASTSYSYSSATSAAKNVAVD